MGYDLHIQRAKRITLEEWTKIVDGDPEQVGFLSYRDGRISIKNPTEDLIAYMTQLARRLKGRVVGDDGEEYAYRAPNKQKPAKSAKVKASTPRKQLPRHEGRPPTVFFLNLYKRKGALYVSASVIGDHIRALDDLMVPTTAAQLADAFVEATEVAHAAMRRPLAKRHPAGTPFWELAGAPTWNQFVVGTTGVELRFEPKRVVLEHTFRDPEHPGSITAGGAVVVLPRNASDDELARAALVLLAEREEKPDHRPIFADREIQFRAPKGTLRAQVARLAAVLGPIKKLDGDETRWSFVHEAWDTRMRMFRRNDTIVLDFTTERGPEDERIERAFAAALPKLRWQVLRVVEGRAAVWPTIRRAT